MNIKILISSQRYNRHTGLTHPLSYQNSKVFSEVLEIILGLGVSEKFEKTFHISYVNLRQLCLV